MNDLDLNKLEKTKARLFEGMIDYMVAGGKDRNCGYTEADVQKCDTILREFIAGLPKPGQRADEPQILACVKRAVLALNQLDAEVGGGLIETDQREDLCEYILCAAKQSGLESDDDVTEEWREW